MLAPSSGMTPSERHPAQRFYSDVLGNPSGEVRGPPVPPRAEPQLPRFHPGEVVQWVMMSHPRQQDNGDQMPTTEAACSPLSIESPCKDGSQIDWDLRLRT